MSLLNCTQAIIKLTEEISGRPVYVTQDPTLGVRATIQTARGSAPMHTVRFRPSPTDPPDYYICWQCEFVIRLFQTPLSQRRLFVVPEEATSKLALLFSEAGLPAPSSEIASALLNGILGQLRSFPIGLRVDDWLFLEYPEIRPLQVRGALEQLAENSSVLASPMRATVPPTIFQSNTAMNAAFALYWARSMADESLSLPYKVIGSADVGQQLLAIYDRSPSTPANDTTLVDAWADHLGLTGWYHWVGYELDS